MQAPEGVWRWEKGTLEGKTVVVIGGGVQRSTKEEQTATVLLDLTRSSMATILL